MTEPMPRRFKALLYAASSEEGGRKTPFGLGYRPLFRLTDVGPYTSSIIDKIGVAQEAMRPGEVSDVEMLLISPDELPGGVKVGTRFELCEGLNVVGWGIVRARAD